MKTLKTLAGQGNKSARAMAGKAWMTTRRNVRELKTENCEQG